MTSFDRNGLIFHEFPLLTWISPEKNDLCSQCKTTLKLPTFEKQNILTWNHILECASYCISKIILGSCGHRGGSHRKSGQSMGCRWICYSWVVGKTSDILTVSWISVRYNSVSSWKRYSRSRKVDWWRCWTCHTWTGYSWNTKKTNLFPSNNPLSLVAWHAHTPVWLYRAKNKIKWSVCTQRVRQKITTQSIQ